MWKIGWTLYYIQDRRWNDNKPSAALDPYIPIWLTTSPAYQRPANFWKCFFFFFQALKGNCEKCCIFRLNWWGPIWSSHSLILHIQIITYTLSINLLWKCWHIFTECHSIKIVAAWFLVLPIHIENLCRLSRGFYIYIYISSSWHHIFAIPPVFIEIYRVGDDRRPVNSSTSLHISDQLGTENVWETLLCWLIVVLWVRKNMYRRERHFGSFHRYSSLLMFPIAQSNLPAGSRSGTKTSQLERILDINVRSLYRRIYYQLNTTSISDRLQCYVDKMASITTADNYTPLPTCPIAGNQSSHFSRQNLTRHGE